MKRGIYVLPNLFTTANLFCGFYSAIASMKGMYEIAAITILIAVVLDSLDGRIARITHTTSKFGGEYDSLCDLVTFGVAPAILIYNWSLLTYGKWGWLAAFLFVVCGALRLARFNVQIGVIDSRVFNGLPILSRGRWALPEPVGHDRYDRPCTVHGQQHQVLQLQGPQLFFTQAIHVFRRDCADSGDRCRGTADHVVHVRFRIQPFRTGMGPVQTRPQVVG
jgi:CDP-diacylglycerol--serine O-phosphatidyltransferase